MFTLRTACLLILRMFWTLSILWAHPACLIATWIDPMMKRTRVAVKVMEGKDLLVSDLPTGTSDPMAFVWVGSNGEGDVDLGKDQRIQVIAVMYGGGG